MRGITLRRLLILLALVSALNVLVSLTVGVYASLTSSSDLVVVNYSSGPACIRVFLESGAEVQFLCTSNFCRVALCKRVRRLVVRYAGFSYEVEVRHSHRVYVVAFPYEFGPSLSRAAAYSVFEKNWENAPWGLEIMVGTEGCYVEESLAGRVFVLFWDYPVREIRGLLDEMSIADQFTRTEVAATALWAAQLVREVKEREVDLAAGAQAVDHILPFPLSVLAKPALLVTAHATRWLDKEFLYVLVLNAIKSVREYVAIFPEWAKVDEEHWVAMYERLEKYTLEPRVPTYAHVLLAGTLLLYLARTLALPALAATLLVLLVKHRQATLRQARRL